MPRLTDKDYLKRHYFLALVWELPLMQPIFGKISPDEQSVLHWYYQTVCTDPDPKLLENRKLWDGDNSSMPQRAGRAWRALMFIYLGNCSYFGIEVDEKDLLPSVRRFNAAIKAKQPSLLKLSREAPRPGGQEHQEGGQKKKGRHQVDVLMKPYASPEEFAKKLLMITIALDDYRRAQEKRAEQDVNTENQS